MPTLIVVNNTKEWPFTIKGVEVVSAKTYLTDPKYGDLRGVKLFNLCRSYRYQTIGYYVTLLASARGQRPLPSISTIQDMKSQTIVRMMSDELDELIQQTLAPVTAKTFELSIYFGRNTERVYDRLSLQLFNLFQAPLLRARFIKEEKWELRGIRPVQVDDIPESRQPFLVEVASEYFSGKRKSVRKRSTAKYDLAILVNPNEEFPPSNTKAIQRFVRAAENLGLDAEIIDRDDFGRIAEFDALFIRETTSVNHHTYRFSRRAAVEGLVVIDDPDSIIKCTNKVYLAEILNRHDVPVPKTLVVYGDNALDVGKELGFPCVLKRPDSSFSQGVVKVEDERELKQQLDALLDKSDLVIAQEYVPTDFDWRIGILDRQPLYACKYHMVRGHWQIYRNDNEGDHDAGDYDTVPVELAPRDVVRIAKKAANLIGDGFYGVDVKKRGKACYVIEVNDNPSIDAGVEDAVLREELYRRVMEVFFNRIEKAKARYA